MLQQVVRAEHDRRHAGQGGRLDPAGKVPGNEIRAGQAAITHGSEQQRTRAGHRPRATADAARHFARAHALEPDLLVLHHKVQQHPPLGAEIAHRGGPPGRQAIGVESDAQAFRGTAFIQVRHPALQVALQQPHLLHMVEQAAPEIGGMRRRLAHQDRLATRASSSLIRCDTADCDSPSACAARSKPPCSTTAASAASNL